MTDSKESLHAPLWLADLLCRLQQTCSRLSLLHCAFCMLHTSPNSDRVPRVVNRPCGQIVGRALPSTEADTCAHIAGDSKASSAFTLHRWQQALQGAAAQHITTEVPGSKHATDGLLHVLQQSARWVMQ